jgi:hypothetical protein
VQRLRPFHVAIDPGRGNTPAIFKFMKINETGDFRSTACP